MAMTTCPECGKAISDQSKFCPHCGFPAAAIRPLVGVEIPLILSVVYTVLIFIYNNVLATSDNNGIVMLIIGVCIAALFALLLKGLLPERAARIAFGVLFTAGGTLLAFDYNISRQYLDFIHGIFSHWIYGGSVGTFLAIFQIVAVVALVLHLLALFTRQVHPLVAAVALSVASLLGLVFYIYDKVYLQSRSTFFIWLGLAICAFYLIGTTYVLTIRRR